MEKNLTIFPSISVWTDGDSIIFDRKFYDGMLMYRKEWVGTISCVMKKSNPPLPTFGTISKKETEIPFHLTVLEEKEKVKHCHLEKASIVLASGDSFEQFHISTLCKKIK